MRFLIPYALVITLLASLPSVRGQSVEAGDEEFLILSPFVVGDGAGHRAADTLAGTRVSTQYVDPGAAQGAPGIAVSIFRRAEAVAIQFVLSHAGDKEEVRTRELYDSVAALDARVAATSGLKLEQREVRFTGGNRKLFSSTRGNTLVSFASIVVFAQLDEQHRLLDRVRQVRELIQDTKLVGATKALDGSVGLYLRRPEAYRGEILQKIFADLAILREGLGGEFEIRPSGLDGRVRTRVASETEIELWIDYGFTIHSVRELTRPAKG